MIESDLPTRGTERWLRSDDGLNSLVDRFLNASLPLPEWTHRAHLGVASALVIAVGRERALVTLRESISRYNIITGGANTDTDGYHETLTVFWLDRVAELLDRLPDTFTRLQRVCAVVEAYGGIRKLHRAYYSFDIFSSLEARKRWIPPDLA